MLGADVAVRVHGRIDTGFGLGAGLLAAATLMPYLVFPPAAAAKSSTPPDTFALRPTPTIGRSAWTLFLGAASADTLRAPAGFAFRAAVEALREDSWGIAIADPSAGRIVTRWKPLRHLLVRLFAGRVDARCFVDVAPLGAYTSIVTFQGALATKHSLEGNPILPFAKKTYRKEAGNWHNEVRLKVGLEPLDWKSRSGAK